MENQPCPLGGLHLCLQINLAVEVTASLSQKVAEAF